MAKPATAERQAKKPDPKGPAYEDDYYGWAMAQAGHLRAGDLGALDLLRLAEEIEDLGKSEYAQLQNALALLMQHMLKWDHQPERPSRSWCLTIREQRRRIARTMRDSPSLKPSWSKAVAEAYEDAVDRAADETGLPDEAFPPACPYDDDALTTRPFTWDAA